MVYTDGTLTNMQNLNTKHLLKTKETGVAHIISEVSTLAQPLPSPYNQPLGGGGGVISWFLSHSLYMCAFVFVLHTDTGRPK